MPNCEMWPEKCVGNGTVYIAVRRLIAIYTCSYTALPAHFHLALMMSKRL